MLKSTIRALRRLLDEQRHLALAIVDRNGLPYAGLLPYAVLPDHRSVLVHASRLSKHSEGLVDATPERRVGVLIHAPDRPDGDPLQIERVSFECSVHPYSRTEAAWAEARDQHYLPRFPGARITFRLGDFTLYRLEFQRGVYVAGFGRALDLEAEDVARLAEDHPAPVRDEATEADE